MFDTTFVVDREMKTRWDPKKTVKQNYIDMGLAVNANEKQEPSSNPVDFGPFPEPAPREEYLTLPEIINCRSMIMKHGTDYLAMWRDIKLNRYQHTRSKLKTMCELYMKEYAERDPLFQAKK